MEGTLNDGPARTPGTLWQVVRGSGLACVVVFGWLLPLTLCGLLHVFLMHGRGWAAADLLVGLCFVLGYAGFVVTPIVAAVLGARRLGSTPAAVAGTAVALLIYTPAAVAAMALILATGKVDNFGAFVLY